MILLQSIFLLRRLVGLAQSTLTLSLQVQQVRSSCFVVLALFLLLFLCCWLSALIQIESIISLHICM